MTILSENIKACRKRMKLTQQGLANEIGTTRSVIGSYEQCRAEPSVWTLKKMSKLFGYSMDQLYSANLYSK